MRVRTIIVILLLLATAGCSAYRTQFDSNPPFAPHYIQKPYVKLAWQSERNGQHIMVSGTVTNTGDPFLHDFELTVRLLDEKGGALAKESATDFSTYIPSGQAEPFRFDLRIPAGTAPARLHFNYTYWLTEAPPAFRGYDDIPHFGTMDGPL
jgi:hypothetical protein